MLNCALTFRQVAVVADVVAHVAAAAAAAAARDNTITAVLRAVVVRLQCMDRAMLEHFSISLLQYLEYCLFFLLEQDTAARHRVGLPLPRLLSEMGVDLVYKFNVGRPVLLLLWVFGF